MKMRNQDNISTYVISKLVLLLMNGKKHSSGGGQNQNTNFEENWGAGGDLHSSRYSSRIICTESRDLLVTKRKHPRGKPQL